MDILKVLVHWGPLKLTRVMYKANVNCSVLKGYLGFLTKQGLVEMKINKRKEKSMRSRNAALQCSNISESSKKGFP